MSSNKISPFHQIWLNAWVKATKQSIEYPSSRCWTLPSSPVNSNQPFQSSTPSPPPSPLLHSVCAWWWDQTGWALSHINTNSVSSWRQQNDWFVTFSKCPLVKGEKTWMLPCASCSLSTRKNIQYTQSPVKSARVDLSLKSGYFFFHWSNLFCLTSCLYLSWVLGC